MQQTKVLFYIVLPLWVSLIIGCGSQDSTNIRSQEKYRETQIASNSLAAVDAVTYLNDIRRSVSLDLLEESSELEVSALSHASYLLANNLYTHTQDNTLSQYLGTTPLQRARRSGYKSGAVLENIYAGDVSGKEAIDILMSDIYHRFAFLTPDASKIGIAERFLEAYDYKRVHVFEIGLDNDSLKSARPDIIFWPYDGAVDIMPVFYEEAPDPLPECSVSGYPVSVEFDPTIYKDIEVDSFVLLDMFGDSLPAVLLDSRSDPNRIFSPYQYALMPLERLSWGGYYQAKIAFHDGSGRSYQKSWYFHTRKLPFDPVVITPETKEISLQSGETYYLYLKPKDCNDRFDRYDYRYTPALSIEEEMIDHNTFMLQATGKGKIEIKFDTGRVLFVDVN
jgi:hypothetical protein